ncbi:MAG TPA: hypothetical protein VK171_08600 [Fimbriimonas sp.]|nr:hypothetical protein [Fimbriimonas sp.]
MAPQTKLAVGTVLEEKSTGRHLEISEAQDCKVASYGAFQYKMNPSNPPIIYANDIGPMPTQKFNVSK